MSKTMTYARSVRRRALLALAVGTWVATPAPGRAQTLFGWPAVGVHLDRYTTVDECLSLTARVRDSVAMVTSVWSDTLPLTGATATAPLPAPVAAVAQRCAARFAVPNASLDDFHLLLSLYLLAGRDADAAALVARRLATVPSSAARARAAVLDTAIGAYLSREGPFRPQPARLAAAEPLITELAAIPAASWSQRWRAYDGMLQGAVAAEDTARAARAANGVVAAVAAAPEADRRSPDYWLAVQASFKALGVLRERVLLDSLRRSTAGYVALRRADWSRASGETGAALRLPIGEPAPAIHGDFWYRRGDARAARPTRGKVALVAFLDQRACMPEASQCGTMWVRYSLLHRLAQRFPEMEVTLVAQTHGYLGAMPPPSPAAEADSLAAWWLGTRQLPGALAVTSTDAWRLPGLDGRRMERATANDTSYAFGPRWPRHDAYLVDRSGTIIDVFELTDRSAEARTARLVEALLAQQTASR
jgi:hypothetical protein